MADLAGWSDLTETPRVSHETLDELAITRPPHRQTLDPPDEARPRFQGTQIIMQCLDYGSNARGDEIWRFLVPQRYRQAADALRPAVGSMVSVDVRPWRLRAAALGEDPGPDG
jgi:hypothetical protein